MAQQLSGVTVVIIVAAGVVTFLLLFIFAKRQIERFSLRSHRGPHAPLGADATKGMRREILRRIDALQKITYEPQVLREDIAAQFAEEDAVLAAKPCHYYRMKAVDDAKSLEMSMVRKKLGKRHTFESLRSYFIVILTPHVDPRVVHQFCDLYEAARFNPKPFEEEEYKAFSLLLRQLRTAVTTLQPKTSIRSPAKNAGGKQGVSLMTGVITSQSDDKEKAASILGGAYIRRLSKKDRKLSEEEQSLCPVHEVSIMSTYSDKQESTMV